MHWFPGKLTLRVTRSSVVVTLLCVCVLAYQSVPVKLLSIFTESENSEGETRSNSAEESEVLECQVRPNRFRTERIEQYSLFLASSQPPCLPMSSFLSCMVVHLDSCKPFCLRC